MSITPTQHSPHGPPLRRTNCSPKRSLPKQKLNFGSPSELSPAPLAGRTSSPTRTSPTKKRPLETTSFYSMFDESDENTPVATNLFKWAATNAKIETSFRAFLSSFPEIISTTTSTTTTTSQLKPPPLKKGKQALKPLKERMASLEKSGIAPEQLNFIRAAATAAELINTDHKHVGEGTFSNVYLLPLNGDSPATVKKVFKEYCTIGSSSVPLQGTSRLYTLAQASVDQFTQIRETYISDQFPVDVLEITNLSSWNQDGYFTQPFVKNMFKPSWDTFVEKIDTYGNRAQISAEEETLLRTIQSVFQKAIELKLCIDFKPENLGYLSVEGQQKIVLIDTFGLSGSCADEIKPMIRSNIKEFSGGNTAISAFLSQVVDQPTLEITSTTLGDAFLNQAPNSVTVGITPTNLPDVFSVDFDFLSQDANSMTVEITPVNLPRGISKNST